MTERNTPPLPPPMSPEAIKAFAHPLRTAMYQYLTDHGSATASRLARHLGESTGQTSYHLRQLERHGLIEDDPDRSTGGRERWWRTVSFSLDPRAYDDDPAARSAADAALRAVVAERARTLQAWFELGERQSEWIDVALHRQSTPELTLTELEELTTAIQTAVDDVLVRAKGAAEQERRTGAADGTAEAPERRRVRIYVDAFPLTLEA